MFIKFWTTFSVSSTVPYDHVCIIPAFDETEENNTCTRTARGHPRICTVSYEQALKAAPNDMDLNGAIVSVYVGIRTVPPGKTLADFEKTTRISKI